MLICVDVELVCGIVRDILVIVVLVVVPVVSVIGEELVIVSLVFAVFLRVGSLRLSLALLLWLLV